MCRTIILLTRKHTPLYEKDTKRNKYNEQTFCHYNLVYDIAPNPKTLSIPEGFMASDLKKNTGRIFIWNIGVNHTVQSLEAE